MARTYERKDLSPWRMHGPAALRQRLAVRIAVAAYPGKIRVGRNWRSKARCESHLVNKDLFFSQNWKELYKAKEVCQGCPVIVDCLAYALSMPFRPPGVWGGTSKHQRDQMIWASSRQEPEPEAEAG